MILVVWFERFLQKLKEEKMLEAIKALSENEFLTVDQRDGISSVFYEIFMQTMNRLLRNFLRSSMSSHMYTEFGKSLSAH